MMTVPTDANLATQALEEESTYRFQAFSVDDAVTLGLSIRKRFRASSRHGKGKGLVISIQTIAGHTLFSCTVGDLGHPSGNSDVSLDSWARLEGMINVVKRTSHSSYYVEKGMSAMGKTAKQMGLDENMRVSGGAFPIWLENALVCPIAIVAAYSGSSQDDHNVSAMHTTIHDRKVEPRDKLVVGTIRDYIKKLRKNEGLPSIPEPGPGLPHRRISEWVSDLGFSHADQPPRHPLEGSVYDHHEHHEHHEGEEPKE
ncbi:hypothetical protein NP233_g10368 [Leucocoprinus birnbaumii]|uniref:Uncharacterized protein n=1 Tax=Leucocoprinus birnbaumii TaxID=56174 RepID=A0AAD5VKG8_9AGAR|nr:hypothetical protein NP233_g10368 [Leucocoprinus birnbaumii]